MCFQTQLSQNDLNPATTTSKMPHKIGGLCVKSKSCLIKSVQSQN